LPRRPWGDISNTESQLESGIAFNEQLSKFSGWAVLAGLGIEIALASAYHAHASFVENWGPVFRYYVASATSPKRAGAARPTPIPIRSV
jgi:hypothetical protein